MEPREIQILELNIQTSSAKLQCEAPTFLGYIMIYTWLVMGVLLLTKVEKSHHSYMMLRITFMTINHILHCFKPEHQAEIRFVKDYH